MVVLRELCVPHAGRGRTCLKQPQSPFPPDPGCTVWPAVTPGSHHSPAQNQRFPSSLPVLQVCMSTFEHEMEKAFAFQASQDKVCSICMEVILEKASASERRFGILSNCNHTYCLSCIRQWRCAKQFENPIIKSCPECHVISEFVIPSVYWVEDQNKRNELIEAFKQGMGKKVCKYFEQGKGTCPFGSKCLYRHAYPDGRLAEPEKPRKQLSSEGTVRFFNSVRLWDFIEN